MLIHKINTFMCSHFEFLVVLVISALVAVQSVSIGRCTCNSFSHNKITN